MNDTVNQSAAVPAVKEQIKLTPVHDDGEFAQLLDSDRFAQIQRVARLFSESDLVPAIFQGKPANCAVALQMAFRMRVDPMLLMQNMYIIKGRPGIEAKLAIALMNSRGPFAGPLEWRQTGDGAQRQWTCFAIHRATQRTCEATVTWAMVEAEGWSRKDGSKWLTMPDIMGRYRSAMILGRLYCPEVLLGLPSDDELRDSEPTLVVGESRIERATIPMPQAKALTVVNQETGEVVTGTDGFVADPPQTAKEGAGTLITTAKVLSTPEADFEGPAAVRKAEAPPAVDPLMNKPASDAQKRAIEATAKRLGKSPSQADEIIADATGFTLATLPQGAVNQALQALAGK